LIEYVIGIEDDNILHEIELKILKNNKLPKVEKALKPFTQKQLFIRAERSNKDYLAGTIKNQEQVKKENRNTGEQMNIIWPNFAWETLKEIYKYYWENDGEQIADKSEANIFTATGQLLKHPQSGQSEKSLEHLNEGTRYLIEGNYEIVY